MPLAPGSPSAKAPRVAQNLVGFFAFFVGLCTIFVLVITVFEAWQEQRQQSWPSATATVRSCDVEPYTSRRPRTLQVVCRIEYFADGEQRQGRVRSSTSPALAQIEAMNAWAEQHEKGSSLEIHYEPARPSHAVLVSTDMPGGGPHTPNNMKLLMAALILFVVLFAITRVLVARNQNADETAPVSS
jgi:hypothetical protein